METGDFEPQTRARRVYLNRRLIEAFLTASAARGNGKRYTQELRRLLEYWRRRLYQRSLRAHRYPSQGTPLLQLVQQALQEPGVTMPQRRLVILRQFTRWLVRTGQMEEHEDFLGQLYQSLQVYPRARRLHARLVALSREFEAAASSGATA